MVAMLEGVITVYLVYQGIALGESGAEAGVERGTMERLWGQSEGWLGLGY